jgi:hypothetical protein
MSAKPTTKTVTKPPRLSPSNASGFRRRSRADAIREKAYADVMCLLNAGQIHPQAAVIRLRQEYRDCFLVEVLRRTLSD